MKGTATPDRDQPVHAAAGSKKISGYRHSDSISSRVQPLLSIAQYYQRRRTFCGVLVTNT
jgi:hypothetical protein